MATLYCQENRNSFTVEDWRAAAVGAQGVFTLPTVAELAPKILVGFEWSSLPKVYQAGKPTPTQEYRAAIDSLFEHSMTKKEAAYFRRESTSTFVPLRPEQTRLLPPRAR